MNNKDLRTQEKEARQEIIDILKTVDSLSEKIQTLLESKVLNGSMSDSLINVCLELHKNARFIREIYYQIGE